MGETLGKVPEVTLISWIIKIAATTLGETGGYAVTMTLNLGYLMGTAIFAALFVVLVAMQVQARAFRPAVYWAVIVATTTVGTTAADLADRSLGIGYPGGVTILAVFLAASLGTWWLAERTVSVACIDTPRAEMFYWVTILFSQTLGTALGDFAADSGGLGFEGGAVCFGAALVSIAALYFFTSLSRTALFWAAFVLTRPLGATMGDLLTKPLHDGGLHLGRIDSSLVLAEFIAACIWILPQRAGGHMPSHA